MSNVLRVPIVLRTPIILNEVDVVRIPIIIHDTGGAVISSLTWDEIVKKYQNLVKFASGMIARQTTMETYISSEDLFQEGMIVLYNLYTKYSSKTEEEFKRLLNASLFRCLYKKARRPNGIYVDIDEMHDLSAESQDVLETMFIEYGVAQIKEMLEDDPVAKAILEEWIQPSERTIWEMNMDVARKYTVFQMAKERGIRVNLPQENIVKMRHIRKALGVSQLIYDLAVTRLREAAKRIFGDDADIAM